MKKLVLLLSIFMVKSAFASPLQNAADQLAYAFETAGDSVIYISTQENGCTDKHKDEVKVESHHAAGYAFNLYGSLGVILENPDVDALANWFATGDTVIFSNDSKTEWVEKNDERYAVWTEYYTIRVNDQCVSIKAAYEEGDLEDEY